MYYGSLEKSDNRCVVYKLKCLDCDACYVGETGRKLRTRVKEHAQDSRLGNRKSAMSMHCIDNRHMFDTEMVRVLDRASNQYVRRLKEAFFIRCSENLVNNKQECLFIYGDWADCLSKLVIT